jgi:hypothetical protein
MKSQQNKPLKVWLIAVSKSDGGLISRSLLLGRSVIYDI